MIATKLFVPTLRRGLVTRPRLVELLRRGAESRLTLVSAPAGFGKTTLLVDWLGRWSGEERSVAWVSLDPSDNEPASFWTYVVTALQGAVPSIGSDVVELIASTPWPTEALLTTVLNDLAAAPGETWLVLDDYHLIDNHDVQDGVAFLLEHLPPHVHVVLATRADPDLPLARWRARGDLVEVRAADLRFTSDEAGAYLAAAGLDLEVQDVEVLEARTEGWIAALQLAALSVRGRDDVRGFIARFAGTDRYIVDYLVEAVLAHQPAHLRSFLLHTAVLDRVTGPLCDAVTARDGGSEMLAGLERANLFIVALDDQREWYRYHHLFADVLRARVLSEQPQLVPVVHQRASRWYEDHGNIEDAVRQALAGHDVDRAVALMEQAVPAMRRNRQDATLVAWIKALPDDAVRRSPVLTVVCSWMLMASGALDQAEARLADAERALAAGPDASGRPWADTQELRTLPATTAVYRAALAQARGDGAGTATHARRALELSAPGDHLARGAAAGFLGFAEWMKGDVSAALSTFTQAVASLRAAGNLVDELSSTVVLADLWLVAGRPGTARRLYEEALALAEARGQPVARATAELHVGLSGLDCEAGDLPSARVHLEAAATLGERAGPSESRYRWFVAMSQVAQAAGDPEEAVALLDEAERLYRPGFFPDVRPIAAMRARVWVAHGKLREAAYWARERRVSVTDEASYLAEFDHLTLVRLLLAQHRQRQDTGRVDQAAGLLARLLEAAQASGRAGSVVEIRMLQALVRDAQGRRPQALESLSEAFGQAPEPEGYVRLFLDEGEPMTALLRDAQRHDVAGDHAGRLLRLAAAFDAEPTSTEPTSTEPTGGRRPQIPPLADPLSERELQVLRLLDSDLSGPQIAQHLFVSHNTLRTHTKHIFTKLEVTSRRAAVRRARERGLM
ncbi:LuxR C-terminal-related transcriptional regulator [Intrasporangium sp.]|uniref:LuxR C-terminal-related transcriptional regulator n=1 Tax=Intrasporangium sp. TaxID=1925024 RepID=UPI002D779A5F|nr:LuxR C-terminal-related transcriptional regulator [Intrasporangium sp.]